MLDFAMSTQLIFCVDMKIFVLRLDPAAGRDEQRASKLHSQEIFLKTRTIIVFDKKQNLSLRASNEGGDALGCVVVFGEGSEDFTDRAHRIAATYN